MNTDNKIDTPPRHAIDWPDVHRRMERLRQAVEHGWAPGAAETDRILRERARALAVVPRQNDAVDEIEIVEFVLGDEHYAVASTYVREVFPLSDLTRLPCTPAFVLGIINVRGEIVSVLDLKKMLGLPGHGIAELNKVLILDSGDMAFGILADLVAGVRNIDTATLQASLATLTGIHTDFLAGVCHPRLIVLDAQKLLSSPTIVVDEQVGS